MMARPACPHSGQSLGSHPCVALSFLPKHFQHYACPPMEFVSKPEPE